MDLESALVANLNPQQAQAVSHHGTPLLIVAGAGSGKTRVITHRIAWLSHVVGIPLWEILAVTFTNKAAKEMRHRVCHLLGMPDDPRLAISTFHSRCAMMLRRESDAAKLSRDFAILDERDQATAVRKAMEELDVSDKRVRPAQVIDFITLAKMRLLTPKDCEQEFQRDDIPYADLYKRYEAILAKNDSLDFEDLIFRSVLLLRDNPNVRAEWQRRYKYLLIDEFQDTNFSQFELVKLLVGPERNICVVGDEDQSIYSWRGADIQNLLSFQTTYPDAELIRLEQNYRSVHNVLKAAGAVISHNTQRIGKTLWTEREDGEPIRSIVGQDDRDEADQVARSIAGLVLGDGVSPEEVAIFYRSHRLSRALEDALRRYKLPYRLVGGTRFYDRAEIKDVLCFLRLAIKPDNDLAFERVVNVPTRGIGRKSQDELVTSARLAGISLYAAARNAVAEGSMRGKAREGLGTFVASIARWHEAAGTSTAGEVLRQVLEDTRYRTEGVGDVNSLDGSARIDNIDELVAVVAEFEETSTAHSLSDFLEQMALDAAREEEKGTAKVSLMTVHNAKGLEFDHVFIVGLDQGVFPNSRTLENPDQFEEERRLFYVALTRARERLVLSRALRRQVNGMWDSGEPSLFLYELPEEVLPMADRRRLGLLDGATRGRGGMSDRPGARTFGSTYGGTPAGPVSIGRPSNLIPARSGGRSTGFKVGDRVVHKIMGPGLITEAGGRPGNERVYVEFDDGRSQDFLVKFAPLKREGE